MATVGLLASAGYPDLPPGPPPTGPKQAIGSAQALGGWVSTLTQGSGGGAEVAAGAVSGAGISPTLIVNATLPGATPGGPGNATGPNFGGGTEGVEVGGATLPDGSGSNSHGSNN